MPEGELSQEDIDSLLGAASGDADPSGDEAPARPSASAAAPVAAPAAAPAAPGSPEEGRQISREQLAEAFDVLKDVPLNVRIELGRSRMYIEDILKLGAGSVVELDKLAGDPLDILVNDRLVAKGELIVLDDYFCIRVTEIVPPEKRRELESK
jgi:flagellar motor switch protein FliN/FliY